MRDQTKFLLSEDQMPKAWYNLQADFAQAACPRCCTRARCSRSDRTIWHRCSRWP
jgi:predicted alternative tryptophan synthase beta-subunit